MLGNDIQWGRYAEVVFTNFDSGLVTTIQSSQNDENGNFISDGLRIAFEYTKTRDESNGTSNGKIVIYGLTDKTFNALGERLRCEIQLKAGYVRSQQNAPKELFYAVLMEKSYEITDGGSIATFTVWGDFLEKMVGDKLVKSFVNPTLTELTLNIAEHMGKGWGFSLEGTDQDRQLLADYLESWKVSAYGYSFAGSPQQELKRIRTSYGIGSRVQGDMMIFFIIDKWYNWHLDGARQISALKAKQIENTLVAQNKTAPATPSQPSVPIITKMQLVQTHSLVLSTDTGLIGSPVLDTVIATKNYDDSLAEGEEVWTKKEQRVLYDKNGKVKKDKKTGEVKMSKKPQTQKVSRLLCKAKAFINANIDFDSQVRLITETGICDGDYRVRKVKFSGDTEGTNWEMDMDLDGQSVNPIA